MSIWNDNTAPRQTPMPAPETREAARFDAPPKRDSVASPAVSASMRGDTAGSRKESLIAADITIEGKIEGGGSVRIAGSFKGDVNVLGDLTIEPGAKVTGSVRAEKVTIAGELIGNIESAAHVELQQSGALTGDLKAGSLSVAAGSRMRGQAEFGWDDGKGGAKVSKHG
jgi:cytoskeletal protein CcmA (bactofilin family)